MTIKTFVYKFLALLTIAGALALAVIIVHFSFAKAVITISANQLPVSTQEEIIVPIKTKEKIAASVDNIENEDGVKTLDELEHLRNKILKNIIDDGSKDITVAPLEAELKTITFSKIYSTPLQSPGTQIEEEASGSVTIYNEMNFDQELVEKTRLQTKDGIIFRIKNYVIVPKNGSITVEAVADSRFIGEKGNIAEGTVLSVPGLSPARQKYIYAKSNEYFKGGVKVVKLITEADFDRGKQEAVPFIKQEALKEFREQGIDVTEKYLVASNITFTTDDKIGEMKPMLTLSITADVEAVQLNQESLILEMQERLNQNIPPTHTILGYNNESLTFEVVGINAEEAVTINAYIEGFETVRDGNSIIKKEELVGASQEEIQTMLLQNKAVRNVDVEFSPFWVTRAPRRVEKIEIIIK